jgi:hypothetical protein
MLQGLPPTDLHTSSLGLLQQARKTENHDSSKWRGDLAATFTTRFGQEPYPWQLAIAEAVALKLDCLCIAGTGAEDHPIYGTIVLGPGE